MASYRLSERAVSDIERIYEHTIVEFGLTQAREYLTGLHQAFELLSANPRKGYDAGELAQGLRRMPYGSHLVYYAIAGRSLRIVRVLHQSMDARRRLTRRARR